MSILSLVPFGGSSLHVGSGALKNDINYARGSNFNEPTTFSVPIEDTNDYHEELPHHRYKRAAKGNQ